MEFLSSPITIISIIILLAALGLLKPLRSLFSGFGEDIDSVNRVKEMAVREWHIGAEVSHAKKMIKVHDKIVDLGEIRSYEDSLQLLKRKIRHDED